MSKQLCPPVQPPSFEAFSAQAVLAETNDILKTTLRLHDQPIVDNKNRARCRLTILSALLAQLSPDEDLRRAARQAEKNIEAARVNQLMRHDIAALVCTVHANYASASSISLDDQDRHLLLCMHADYVCSGAQLHNDTERESFRRASSTLSDICVAAQDTMIEPEDGIWFEYAQLAGVPKDVLATLVRDGTRVHVSFRKSHVAAVMRYATKSDTRRRCLVANWHRLPENVERLSRAVALRDEIARLLGFEHHAALKMRSRMATSVADVTQQLEELYEGLIPVAQAETDKLACYKRQHPADDCDHTATLFEWDKSFYTQKRNQNDSTAGVAPFSEYFEVRRTAQAMLDVFRDLFGMDFQSFVTSTWHDSVTCFQVWDTPSEGGQFLGYLYLDLFERAGKYRGAHCIELQPGFLEHDGKKHYPIIVLACCYLNPSKLRPSLLQHNEVVTMFHELGHAIHSLVGKTKYGLGRSRDYSEIPSIMLENWTWVPDVLIRIGKHYTTLEHGVESEGTLPRDHAEAICAKRNPSRANALLGHVWPALFDLAIHTPPTHAAALEMNATKIWNTTKQRIITTNSGNNPQDWGAGQARFIHMFRHNDAGYFSYPLSMAYAADLFAYAFAEDPMSAASGRRWRYAVLEPGASRPEMEILKAFLGRPPSVRAIIEELNPRSS